MAAVFLAAAHVARKGQLALHGFAEAFQRGLVCREGQRCVHHFGPGGACAHHHANLAILLGGAILLFTGIASWRTMASVFVGGLAMGYLFQALGVTTYPAWYHLIVGGFAFGAVFMATDPVTSSQTNTGKYIVGLMTGALAVLIRVVNPAYPEGMMLSILFMNALAPLVDYYVVEANISRRRKRVKLAK